MASATSPQELPAKIEEEASNSDDETPASAGGVSRPPSSYPFPDFNPPSSRPASSCQFREPPTTFSLFPKPRASTPRLSRGSKPPVAFRTRSSSNLLDEYYNPPERRAPWHDTDDLARRRQMSDMDRQTIGELVDFLRNQAPPPDNFMSIPDDPDAEDDRGRWLKLKPFANGRSRSAPKRPKPLRLPDSAVAGRTIGGHRHIAISIPVEHSPFGLNPSSQYPVYNKDGEPNADQDSVMRFTDSNGVVTVLRTVAENQESPASGAFSHKSCRPVSVTHESSRTPVSRSQSLNEPSHTRDYSTASLPPTPLSHSRSCHLDLRSSEKEAGQPRRARPPISPGSEGTPTSATTPSTPGRPRPMPRRWSVFPAVSRGPAESIDGIMYGQRRPPVSANARQPMSRAATYSGRPRSSTGASSCNNKTAAKANGARVPTIKVSSGRDSIMNWQGQVRDAVTEQEAGGRKPPESPALSARSGESRQSRKEKVRQRKKRDVEASRLSWGRRKVGADDDSLPRSSLTLSETSQAKADHETDNTDSGSGGTMARMPSMTPVIVVADVKPSTPPPASPAALSTPASALVRSTLTLPLTPRGRSPARSLQDGFLSTRTDYRQASLAVRSAVSPARLQPASADKAAYEGRLREIEQRIGKLESSGDTWMKSMLPVLDNLNRTLVKLQDERKCLDEDEVGLEAQERKPPPPRVVLPMRKLTRRSTLNEKMLLDLRRIEKGEVDIIKDGSGLESVMRDLQANSRECSPGRETASRKQEMGVAF